MVQDFFRQQWQQDGKTLWTKHQLTEWDESPFRLDSFVHSKNFRNLDPFNNLNPSLLAERSWHLLKEGVIRDVSGNNFSGVAAENFTIRTALTGSSPVGWRLVASNISGTGTW